jgi:hypothetical protein
MRLEDEPERPLGTDPVDLRAQVCSQVGIVDTSQESVELISHRPMTLR